MEVYETCKTQLSHYPHHPIRTGICQKIILSISSFAHALQTRVSSTPRPLLTKPCSNPRARNPVLRFFLTRVTSLVQWKRLLKCEIFCGRTQKTESFVWRKNVWPFTDFSIRTASVSHRFLLSFILLPGPVRSSRRINSAV
jgi:hypothetical protein